MVWIDFILQICVSSLNKIGVLAIYCSKANTLLLPDDILV